MQIAAMLTMLIDHIGIVFFPGDAVWRIIGRIAFPLYAYGIVQGYLHTRSLERYLKRLVLIGIVSQIPYMWALQIVRVNVIGTFLVSLLVLLAFDRLSSRAGKALAAAGGLILLEAVSFDYGGYGLLLMLVYRYAATASWGVPLHFGLNVLYVAVKGWTLQLYSIVPTLALYARNALAPGKPFRGAPRWLWLSFYPAHLAMLGVLRWGIAHGRPLAAAAIVLAGCAAIPAAARWLGRRRPERERAKEPGDGG